MDEQERREAWLRARGWTQENIGGGLWWYDPSTGRCYGRSQRAAKIELGRNIGAAIDAMLRLQELEAQLARVAVLVRDMASPSIGIQESVEKWRALCAEFGRGHYVG